MSLVILCDIVVFIFTLGILMLLPKLVLLLAEVVLIVLMTVCLNKILEYIFAFCVVCLGFQS